MENNKSGEVFKNYLRDTIQFIADDALEAKKKSLEAKDDFNDGRRLAYYEVVSTLVNQAKTFEIDLHDINLGNIDPDKDLM